MQQVIQRFREMTGQTVSPLPENNGQYLKDQIQGVGQDLYQGTKSAIELSPPVQAATRYAKAKSYLGQGMNIPYTEQIEQVKQDAGNFLPATKLAGYGSKTALMGGAAVGGLLSTVKALLEQEKMTPNKIMGIAGDVIGGARKGARTAPLSLVFPLLKKGDGLTTKEVPKSIDSMHGRTIKMTPKPDGTGWNVDQRFGKPLQTAIKAVKESRPAHQKILEDLWNKGDLKGAQKVIDSMAQNDPYKSSMQMLQKMKLGN